MSWTLSAELPATKALFPLYLIYNVTVGALRKVGRIALIGMNHSE